MNDDESLCIKWNDVEIIYNYLPALESSHAIAYAFKIAKKYSKDDCIIVNLSGRGDKDLQTILNLK